MVYTHSMILIGIVLPASLVLANTEEVDPTWNLTKEQWSERVVEYLRFYQWQKSSMDPEEKMSSIVEKLMVQAWIHTLHPELHEVKEFLTEDSSMTVEALKTNLISSLKSMEKAVVAKAVFQQAEDFVVKIHVKILTEGSKLGIDEEQLSRISLFNTAYSYKMCLQSFILDFLEEPYSEKYIIKKGDKERIFRPRYYLDQDWKFFYGYRHEGEGNWMADDV